MLWALLRRAAFQIKQVNIKEMGLALIRQEDSDSCCQALGMTCLGANECLQNSIACSNGNPMLFRNSDSCWKPQCLI